MHATFLKNMAFLKQNLPAIYQFYQGYTANNIQLAVDDNGFINLAVNNAFLYPEDPKAMSLQQVKTFLQNPPIQQSLSTVVPQLHFYNSR